MKIKTPTLKDKAEVLTYRKFIKAVGGFILQRKRKK
jgi:hypothetical protein